MMFDTTIFVPFERLAEYGYPGKSKPHLRKLIAKGEFPTPVVLSAHRVAWRREDLLMWQRTRPKREYSKT
jgi:predicted DNA-binding transcriptional regulator AlpA